MLMVLWEMVVHQGNFQIKIVGLDLSMVQSQIEMEDLCLHNLVMVKVSFLVESKIVERDNHGLGILKREPTLYLNVKFVIKKRSYCS